MSDVVENFFPVRVFCAVTVTPGNGMLPLLTAPCSLPPVRVDGACGEATAAADDGARLDVAEGA
jgi:hypothetical protein